MFFPEASRRLAPVRTVAPTGFIISVEDLQAHVRTDSNFDADVINSLLLVVTQMLDGWTGMLGLCLLTQTWTVKWDSFPWRYWHGGEQSAFRGWPVSGAAVIRLPLAPIQSVTVTYYDSGNALQTLSPSVYGLYQDGEGWFIQLNQGQSWPTTYQRPDAVTVVMVAGYGASPDIPFPIRHAAKMLVANWYENRSSVGTSTAEVDALLGLYKRTWVH